ncbi:hypothetical protein ACOMHN_044297 [Nucella lapillus]
MARNKHAEKDQCQNASLPNSNWLSGWDRRTISCGYCKERFSNRRGIQRHLQLKNCPRMPGRAQILGLKPQGSPSASARHKSAQGKW